VIFEQFLNQLSKYGVAKLESPIFYTFPIGIRFKIAISHPYNIAGILKKSFVDECVDRAESIFKSLDFSGDVLMVFNADKSERNAINTFTECFSGQYDKEVIEITDVDDESNEYQYERFFFKLKTEQLLIKKLFKLIVEADFGGILSFNSAIYIFDLEKEIMFHLYDDRGLDVVSSNKKALMPIYSQFHDWILPYDVEKIDKLFNSSE